MRTTATRILVEFSALSRIMQQARRRRAVAASKHPLSAHLRIICRPVSDLPWSGACRTTTCSDHDEAMPSNMPNDHRL